MYTKVSVYTCAKSVFVVSKINANAFLTCPIQLREATPNTLDSCMPMKNFSNCTHYCWNTKSFLSTFFLGVLHHVCVVHKFADLKLVFIREVLDRRLPEREYLNVTSWSDVTVQPQKLCSQVCLQRLNFFLSAWRHFIQQWVMSHVQNPGQRGNLNLPIIFLKYLSLCHTSGGKSFGYW